MALRLKHGLDFDPGVFAGPCCWVTPERGAMILTGQRRVVPRM
jgi:hypothetical protein